MHKAHGRYSFWLLLVVFAVGCNRNYLDLPNPKPANPSFSVVTGINKDILITLENRPTLGGFSISYKAENLSLKEVKNLTILLEFYKNASAPMYEDLVFRKVVEIDKLDAGKTSSFTELSKDQKLVFDSTKIKIVLLSASDYQQRLGGDYPSGFVKQYQISDTSASDTMAIDTVFGSAQGYVAQDGTMTLRLKMENTKSNAYRLEGKLFKQTKLSGFLFDGNASRYPIRPKALSDSTNTIFQLPAGTDSTLLFSIVADSANRKKYVFSFSLYKR